MKRAALALGFLVFSAALASAIGVDVEELKTGQKVEFVNYAGPINIFQTDLNIRGIGRSLADQVRRGAVVAAVEVKYSAIHAVDPAQPEKLAADIISIDRDAKVDHIDNVRRIVSAYLESLYGYSRKDSDTLALLTSYYNAVYRANLGYFTGKYKTVVLSHLDAKRVGISTKYYEWPGNTQMVVPLNDRITGSVLGALSSTELTTKVVMDQLKSKEDQGIPERKAVVELKQKEADQGRAIIDAEAKKLLDQQQKTAAQEAALEKARAEARALTDAQAKAAAEEKIKAQEAELAAQKEAQKAEAERIAAQEQAVAQKTQEVSQEKAAIAADETAQKIAQNPEAVKQELAQRAAEVAKREEAAQKGETDSAIFGGKLYYLKIKEYLTGGHYNNEMLIINAASGKVLQKSAESRICGRKFDLFKNGVAVITFKADHSEGHFLTLLDLDTLERKAISDEAVFYRGFVETREDFTYAVVDRGKSYFLGKFDTNMKMAAISKDPVDGDSFISFFGELVYINSQDKKILVLNRADLTTSSVVEP